MNRRSKGRALGVRSTEVVVTDLDRSIDFYTGILGLNLRLDERRYNWVELGPDEDMGLIALSEYRGEGRKPGGSTGLVLIVEDLNSFYKNALKDGVVFTSPPGRRPWRGVVAKVLDPDENEITLLDSKKVSPWMMGA